MTARVPDASEAERRGAVMEATERDYAALKNELLAALPELGIDRLGVASSEPFTALKDVLLRHRELGRESGFEHPDLDERTDPSLLFDTPRSILSIAIAYPSKLVDPPKSEPGARRGILSRSAWGTD